MCKKIDNNKRRRKLFITRLSSYTWRRLSVESACVSNKKLPSSFIITRLSSYTWRRLSVESARVSLFCVFHRIGEHSSQDLFDFVNLTSSCSLIPQKCQQAPVQTFFPALDRKTTQLNQKQTNGAAFHLISPRLIVV